MRLRTFLATGLLCLLGGVAWQIVHGQTTPANEETIDLLAGEILEILPVHTVLSPQYGWVLLKDQTETESEQFIEGAMANIFRYRPIQPGRYTLFGDISSKDDATHVRYTFRLNVKARQPGQTTLLTASG